MTRIIAWGAGILAAAVGATAATAHVYAQLTTEHKRTFLTFSGAVQVPGATLPPGKYVFRIATPDNQMVWQVFDASEHHLLASFFYVNTGNRTVQELNAANNKPIVRFYETPRGVAPALKVLYYPWDSEGYVFLYPKSQAERIAALAHQPVLATNSDPAKSRLAQVMTVQPDANSAVQSTEAAKRSR